MKPSTFAFPFATHSLLETGMTLRVYLVAHAPPEPQPWFQPKMNTERPTPTVSVHLSGKETTNIEEIVAWDTEYRRQQYLQWPVAWADAQMAILES